MTAQGGREREKYTERVRASQPPTNSRTCGVTAIQSVAEHPGKWFRANTKSRIHCVFTRSREFGTSDILPPDSIISLTFIPRLGSSTGGLYVT